MFSFGFGSFQLVIWISRSGNMGQVADVIKGLEAKLADAQNQLSIANQRGQTLSDQLAQANASLATAQANQLDDADKAAVAEAQAILNPPAPAAPAQPA